MSEQLKLEQSSRNYQSLNFLNIVSHPSLPIFGIFIVYHFVAIIVSLWTSEDGQFYLGFKEIDSFIISSRGECSTQDCGRVRAREVQADYLSGSED